LAVLAPLYPLVAVKRNPSLRERLTGGREDGELPTDCQQGLKPAETGSGATGKKLPIRPLSSAARKLTATP